MDMILPNISLGSSFTARSSQSSLTSSGRRPARQDRESETHLGFLSVLRLDRASDQQVESLVSPAQLDIGLYRTES